MNDEKKPPQPDGRTSSAPEKQSARALPPLRWPDHGPWGVCLVVGYIAAASLPIVLALALQAGLYGPFLRIAGKGAALVGFMLLVLQTVLTSRIRLIERPFGLDRVMRFHKRIAITAGVLLLLHPILLGLGQSENWKLSFVPAWGINLGLIALSLLGVGVLFALFFPTLGVEYQVWRFLHKGMIAVLIVGFVHALYIGSAFGWAGMRILWWILFLTAVGLFLYRNFFVPAWGRRRFRVQSVEAETHNTFTLKLVSERGRPLEHQPGQFMFLKLLRPGRTSEEHPFTISSSPTREEPVTVTIKQSGDFTNTIHQTRPGDQARIEAPYGRFSFAYRDAKSFLFIAGGVGITPIMSMLRALEDIRDRRPATLIYANRTERDIIFREELSRRADVVRTVHVLSDAGPDWKGLRGFVTAEIIRNTGGELLKEADVFLCGPPPMMDALVRMLRSLGVPAKRIHHERFAL